MSFAILGMGTAVPAATITQDEALGLARVLCCRTPEQNTWVPLMYTRPFSSVYLSSSETVAAASAARSGAFMRGVSPGS